MNRLLRGPRLEFLPVMLVFLVFAVCTLFVITLGGTIYKNTVELTNYKYDEQTCLAYVWTKVRSSDAKGRVYIEEFESLDALCVEEEFDGTIYRTLIYSYNGRLMELFYEEGLSFAPMAGMDVMDCQDLSFDELESGVIRVTAGTEHILVFPRSTAKERA